MPQQKLSIGIYDRWNNTSLDSSIAKLYPAGDSPGSKMNDAGSPSGSAKPRAEYTLSLSPPQKTRGSRRYSGVVVFSVWGDTKEEVDDYITSIYDAYVNSDNAASNPLTITGGSVLIVDDGASDVQKVDDDTFQGDITFQIDISVDNQTP